MAHPSRVVLALVLTLAAAACSHDLKVALQEHALAPQLNRGVADILAADLQALAVETPQQRVLDTFGTPLVVHIEGTPCTPWDSCPYASSKLIYRTKESWTCTVTFLSGRIDRAATCEPFRPQLILGPGDLDPKSGLTGNPGR